MPIYEYKATDEKKNCYYCRGGFEAIQQLSDEPLTECLKCGSPIAKQISTASIGESLSSSDDRAKNAGFTKLKRLGKGEYEKQF